MKTNNNKSRKNKSSKKVEKNGLSHQSIIKNCKVDRNLQNFKNLQLSLTAIYSALFTYCCIGIGVKSCALNGVVTFWSFQQRWSRGHKAQSQSQGHQKNPRPRPKPRTAFPRTDPLEAKGRNARGQGPRTQLQRFSKKRGFQKSFSGDLQFFQAYPEFLIGRPKPQITCNDVIKIFQKRKFLWDKDIVRWKI